MTTTDPDRTIDDEALRQLGRRLAEIVLPEAERSTAAVRDLAQALDLDWAIERDEDLASHLLSRTRAVGSSRPATDPDITD